MQAKFKDAMLRESINQRCSAAEASKAQWNSLQRGLIASLIPQKMHASPPRMSYM